MEDDKNDTENIFFPLNRSKAVKSAFIEISVKTSSEILNIDKNERYENHITIIYCLY